MGSRLITSRGIHTTPLFYGAAATMGLLALYFAIVALASRSFDHAQELMWTDRYYVAAIAAGFGIQAGLMRYARLALKDAHNRTSTVAGATGTGASTVSMIACCAHHVADFAPFLGASGVVIFFNDYRYETMLAGIGINVMGILFMLRRMARWGILPWQAARIENT